MPGRAERLLALLQALRAHRRPVAATKLAEELGVSVRTIYRDIDALRAQGAAIDGEAGVGFLLRPGFTLPPLMFTPDELDALALGARWVARNADAELAKAAQRATAKIAAVAGPEFGEGLDAPALLVSPRDSCTADDAWMPRLRAAMRAERKIAVDYRDGAGAASRRVVWPVTIGFLGDVRMVAAWCELRAAFRHFRVDRIAGLEMLEERLPKRRRALMGEWRKSEGGPHDADNP